MKVLFPVSAVIILFFSGSVYGQMEIRKELEKKLNTFLLLDPGESPLVFTEHSFTMLDTNGRPEASFQYEQIADLRRWLEVFPSDTTWYGLDGVRKISRAGVNPEPVNRKILDGLRIAIDPGHTSADFEEAQTEKKFVKIWFRNKYYRLTEARLNLATALLLEDSLKKLGASVLLTRKDAGNTDGIRFKEWKEKKLLSSIYSEQNRGRIDSAQALHLRTTASDRELFIFYNNLDLEARAEKINQFAPDLAIMIHYNVDVKNEPWESVSTKNYSMTFVPGAFSANELLRKEDRRNLMRLLVSETLERSVLLGDFTERAFIENLGVPPAPETGIPYLESYSKPTGKAGVFSRNLSMTRLVNAPLVYGEPLYQDNQKEIERLIRVDGWISRETWNLRLKEVADSYLQGVLDYIRVQQGLKKQ